MIRSSWILAAVTLAGPLFAADPQTPGSDQKTPAVSPELKPIIDRLDRFELMIKKMDEQQGRMLEVTAAAIQKDINELRDQMSGVRKEIDELRGRINRDSYTAKKTTDGAGATVVLVNEHPMMMMETLVNAATHRVMPGMSLSVPVAPGPVNIQVLQTDPFVRARMLMPGETKIVTMR